MNDVTQILASITEGDQAAVDKLLPLVYQELKGIAAHKMSRENPGNTLQPTALVHEAWVRLLGESEQQFNNRAHFFAAAAEAMRRILVESARRKRSLKRGGNAEREELNDDIMEPVRTDELLAIDESLDLLAQEDPQAASLVKLRYFVGMTMEEAATALNLPVRSAERLWAYARAWLRRSLQGGR